MENYETAKSTGSFGPLSESNDKCIGNIDDKTTPNHILNNSLMCENSDSSTKTPDHITLDADQFDEGEVVQTSEDLNHGLHDANEDEETAFLHWKDKAVHLRSVTTRDSVANGPSVPPHLLARLSVAGSVGIPVYPIPPQQEPSDGGLHAWLVMFASFFCNGIMFGTINSSGIIFDVLQKDLEEQALCLSLTIGMTFLMSMASGVLIDKFGIRVTTFVGGGLSTLAMFLSSLFYKQIEYLTLTFGVMLGIGFSLAYTPSLVILGHYFRRRMGIVNGFVTAGSSLFTVVMPALFKIVLESYGLNVLMQVLAALLALLMVCAFIFKPRLAVLPPDVNTILDSQSAKNHRCSAFLHAFKRCLGQFINIEIWRNKRYIIWAVCIPLALFGYFVPYIHLVAYTKSVLGEDSPAYILVQCIAVTSGIGRLLFGFIADQPWVNRIILQQISFFFIGAQMMLLAAWSNFTFFLVLSLGMGLFDGCFISLLGPVAFDIVGPAGAPQAIGSLLTLCSVPLTFGPYFAGLLKDILGSYTIPFLLAGIPPIVGAIALFSVKCVHQAPGTGCPGSPLAQDCGTSQQNNATSLQRQPSSCGLEQLTTVSHENGGTCVDSSAAQVDALDSSV